MQSQGESSVIIGIDPGSLRTGFGVVAYDGTKLVHVTHGTIILDKTKSISDRLADLANDMTTLINKYQPTQAIVEDIFLFNNPRSALILGQARGAALAILGMKNIPTLTLSATRVKSLIAGRGRAQKFQVAQMVALELKVALSSSKDASDALAIALAGAYALERM